MFKESRKLDESDESPDRDCQDSASVSIRWHGFTKGFVSKFTYFLRTIEGFEEYTDILQEVINDAFVPSLAGEDTPFTPTQNRLFSLPASQGGLGIPQLKEQASIQFSASLNLTSAHRESIKDQNTCVREKNRDGRGTPSQL